ncbi:MAG: hypothetical protein ABI165_09965, partial [Bryobacteraceae bacterium]
MSLGGCLLADDLSNQAWQLESAGNAAGALDLLERTAQAAPQDAASLRDYAEFLDLHRDPGARAAYEKLLAVIPAGDRAPVLRRLALLDLEAGDRNAAARHLELYGKAGGAGLALSTDMSAQAAAQQVIEIPGPLRSFARMAALSPDLSLADVLPALARNIVTNGYQAAASNEALEQTEYLKLVVRYLSQARELSKLAGKDGMIDIAQCDSSQTADLLRVLGYRMRGGCGSEVVLETVNATRAFLTIDSGFPVAGLEQALRTNRPFLYDYRATKAPVLYGQDYWLSAKERQGGEFIDGFIADPTLCRLYLGLSKLDPETADALRKAIPAQRIKAYAHVLDFFGAMFEVRNGKAIVPGGARSEKAWGEMAGATPEKGAVFFEKVLQKDDGWLASYFDALARINGPVRDYLTEPERLKRFYAAIRGKVTSPGPARPVFRSNTDMLLLTTRLRLEASGRPHVPGSLEVWKNLFVNHPRGKYDAKLSRAAGAWKDPDDVLEALFGLCRKSVENEPLKIFMALSDVDRQRSTPLAAGTVNRMAREYRSFGAQYPIFAEAPEVSDKTILQFLDTAQAINQMKEQGLRADTAGTMQALVSMWQILCRQNSIAPKEEDAALAAVLAPFSKIKSERDLFDGGRSGVHALLAAANSPAGGSAQDRAMDLLAGTGPGGDSEAHTQVVEEMIRIFESQRLVSLDTLFQLADNLESVAKGEKLNNALVAKLASRISAIQLPRSALTGAEKNSLSFGYWTERHIDAQRKLNLRAAIEKASKDPEKLKDLRGVLAPFLRDTLVGLNYVHYAPPGAQILYTNPLFVRSHDFLGIQGASQMWKSTDVFGTGWPSSAGGRLVGSLAGLPYALAEAEQNFLVPSREQALIWGDLVPQMMLSAKIPRWWRVTPAQVHWVGLHMNYGARLVAESGLNRPRRDEVLALLNRHAPPQRVYAIQKLLERGQVKDALDEIMPSELYAIACETMEAHPDADGLVPAEIRRLRAADPDRVTARAIAKAFGTPKPTLANSYQPELLYLRTFPTLMGYSSRILAESWESNLLYYAALADDVHMRPAQLNVAIPEWTQQ